MHPHLKHGMREDGMALLISVIILLLISAVGLSALQSATGEASAGGRSNRKLSTFFAAESGLSLVWNQFTSTTTGVPNPQLFDDPNFMQDLYGGFTQVRTGTADTATPLAPQQVGSARPKGSALNVNAANVYTQGIYRVDVLATDPTGGRVELQAQYAVIEGGSYK